VRNSFVYSRNGKLRTAEFQVWNLFGFASERKTSVKSKISGSGPFQKRAGHFGMSVMNVRTWSSGRSYEHINGDILGKDVKGHKSFTICFCPGLVGIIVSEKNQLKFDNLQQGSVKSHKSITQFNRNLLIIIIVIVIPVFIILIIITLKPRARK
jgi:hypothetical protein